MKLTLLEITQDILNDLDDDLVNSIDDTPDSQQVAQIVKTTYYEYITQSAPWLWRTKTLDGVSDTDTPTHMKLSDNIAEIECVKYNKRKSTDTKDKYDDVEYLDPNEFLSMMEGRDSSKSTVTTVTDTGGVKLYVINDTAPTYYTSFDDEYLVFDSYDTAVDSTLQSSKSQIRAKVIPVWSGVDDFIPDLPQEQFPAFLAECKSKCFVVKKQTVNSKQEDVARKLKARSKQNNWRVKGGVSYPDYGRKR